MRPLQRLTVIVPVFNEAAGLPAFWARISAVLDTLADTVTGELLFIDDGSRDDSLAVIQALAMRDARVGFLALSRNFGKEIAMSAGLDFADGDWVVLIDADLQDPPELIPTLLAKAREGFDTVYARRAARLGEGLSPEKAIPRMREMLAVAAPRAVGRECADARKSGVSATPARVAAYTPHQMRAAGYSCTEVRKAGVMPRECKRAGYTFEEAQAAGVSGGAPAARKWRTAGTADAWANSLEANPVDWMWNECCE